MRWLITLLDSLSQTAGWCIPVRVDGEWRPWTNGANESISVAAHRWALQGQFEKVQAVIDFVFSPRKRNHCQEAFEYDYQQAKQYVQVADGLRA